MDENSNYLEIKKVTKSYSSKCAVKDVTLSIPRNSIYGLLGPNGAGKTTLIRMITQIFCPDKGEIFIGGEKLKEKHLQLIGYMPEERGLYKKMKVGEHIVYFLRLKGLSKSDAVEKTQEWLKKLSLSDWKNKSIGELSKGMQQKIQFIITVAHEPSLLILDEPFSGLDPISTQLIKDTIRELKNNGVTTIFSTHRMEQVEELCEKIALINSSSVILEDEIHNVKKRFQKNIYRVESYEDLSFLKTFPDLEVMELKNNYGILKLTNGLNAREFLIKLINKIDITKFELTLPTLNEIFIELVGKNNE